MKNKITTALEATGFPFADYGWSDKPKGDYGVVSIDGQAALRADRDSAAETIAKGTVDLFTRDFTLHPLHAIGNVLRGLGITWKLEGIDFEPDPGYLHYAWSFADTGGALNPVITFRNADGTELKSLRLPYGAILVYTGETPAKPDNPPYVYTFTGWTPGIVPATEDATYTAAFEIQRMPLIGRARIGKDRIGGVIVAEEGT